MNLAYNAAGLISSVADSSGQHHHVPVRSNKPIPHVRDRSYNGQITSYAYGASSGTPAQNGLSSIAYRRRDTTNTSPTISGAVWPAPYERRRYQTETYATPSDK